MTTSPEPGTDAAMAGTATATARSTVRGGRPTAPGAARPPAAAPRSLPQHPQPPGETGGPAGPEPTRYGDWEKGGRCFDF